MGPKKLRHFDLWVFGFLLMGVVLVFAWKPLQESVAFHAGLGGQSFGGVGLGLEPPCLCGSRAGVGSILFIAFMAQGPSKF